MSPFNVWSWLRQAFLRTKRGARENKRRPLTLERLEDRTTPSIVLNAQNLTAVEGVDALFTVATFTNNVPGPPQVSNYKAAIDWGDGQTEANVAVAFDPATAVYTVAAQHTYADETPTDYPKTLTVTVNESSPSQTATRTGAVTVLDAPLVSVAGTNYTFIGNGATGANTTVATFTDPSPESVAHYGATINWGDGAPADSGADVEIVDDGAGNFSVISAAGHTYTADGLYTITATITHGTLNAVQTDATAAVMDLSALTVANAPVNATAGVAIGNQPIATFNDGSNTSPTTHYAATINWGDGATTTGDVVQNAPGGAYEVVDATTPHTYAANGTYAITVTVAEMNGSVVLRQASNTGPVILMGFTAGEFDNLLALSKNDYQSIGIWGDSNSDSDVLRQFLPTPPDNAYPRDIYGVGVHGGYSPGQTAQVVPQAISDTRPVLAFLMTGTIDPTDVAGARQTISGILDEAAAAGVVVVLTTIPPRHLPTGPDLTDPDSMIPAFNAMIESLAASRGLPVFDLYSLVEPLPNEGLSSDEVHLDAEAQQIHTLGADEIWDAFQSQILGPWEAAHPRYSVGLLADGEVTLNGRSVGGSMRQISVGYDAQGYQEIAAVGTDSSLWRFDTETMVWTNLTGLGRQIVQGRGEQFLVGTDSSVLRRTDGADGWNSIGGLAYEISLGQDIDGDDQIGIEGMDTSIWDYNARNGWFFTGGLGSHVTVGSDHTYWMTYAGQLGVFTQINGTVVVSGQGSSYAYGQDAYNGDWIAFVTTTGDVQVYNRGGGWMDTGVTASAVLSVDDGSVHMATPYGDVLWNEPLLYVY